MGPRTTAVVIKAAFLCSLFVIDIGKAGRKLKQHVSSFFKISDILTFFTILAWCSVGVFTCATAKIFCKNKQLHQINIFILYTFACVYNRKKDNSAMICLLYFAYFVRIYNHCAKPKITGVCVK